MPCGIPSVYILYGYNVNLGAVLAYRHAAIVMFAVVRAIVLRHEKCNGIRSHIDIHVVVVAPMPFGIISVIYVSISYHTFTISDGGVLSKKVAKCSIDKKSYELMQIKHLFIALSRKRVGFTRFGKMDFPISFAKFLLNIVYFSRNFTWLCKNLFFLNCFAPYGE